MLIAKRIGTCQMGNAQNPLDVMAVFYEDHYNTMWEPPINKRVEEEDRSRVGYFF